MHKSVKKLYNEVTLLSDAIFESTSKSVTIYPPDENGFIVGFLIHDDKFLVRYDKWYEIFDKEDLAYECFWFGLTNKCRLLVHSKKGKDFHWCMEYKKRNDWTTYSERVKNDYRFWLKKDSRYLSNNLIK